MDFFPGFWFNQALVCHARGVALSRSSTRYRGLVDAARVLFRFEVPGSYAMPINLSTVPKRYLLGGGVLLLIILGLIIGAVHPYKHALGSQTASLPDVEV